MEASVSSTSTVSTTSPPPPTDVKPSSTIYIHNLGGTIKMGELKRSLNEVFSEFGPIVGVHAKKTDKGRGQAWVSFKDIESATNAMLSKQGAVFFEKRMKIKYAKSDSDVVSKLKGNAHERHREMKRKKRKKKTHEAKKALAYQYRELTSCSNLIHPLMAEPAADVQTPNKVLFLSNLPRDTTVFMLRILFMPFAGFREVRFPAGRHDIAFVEYDNVTNSSAAKNAMHGYEILATYFMNVTFAKN